MADIFVSKLLVPQRPAIAIRRSALLSRLEATGTGSPALLRGPAGYGKTSLLVDLVNESPGVVCWLALDKWDRDPAVLLHYLETGVRRALALPAPEDTGAGDRTQLAAIASVIAQAEHSVDVVLDDVHELDGANPVLELLDYLVTRLPPNCRLFLASRTELQLPSWARLAAAGRAKDIAPEELLMTTGEVRDLWTAAGHPPADDAFIERLVEVSNGWAVAVAMAARSEAAGDADVRQLMTQFLGGEVIARLPGDVRDFLEKTSALETLDVSRCETMLGGEPERDVGALLRLLPTINVPATVLSTNPVEVRLHPLVRELMQTRLKAERPDVYRAGHLAAAQLDIGNGRVNEALAHLAAAEAWDEFAEVAEAEAPRAYEAGRWHSVASWLTLLPAADLRRHPELGTWQARILVRLGQCDHALTAINDALTEGGALPLAVAASLETVRAAALRTKGEIGAAVKASEEAKKLAFGANASVEVVAEARKELGLSLISQGAFEDGIEELLAALEIRQFRGEASDVAFLSGCLGSAYGAIGRLSESVAYLEQARQKFGRGQNSKELSWVLNNLGVTYWNLGNLERAGSVLGDCLSCARAGGHRRAEGFALASLADVDRVTAALEVARTRYETVIDIAEEVNDVTLGTLGLIGLADVERRAGRYPEAETLARRAMASAESRIAKSEEALARVVLARAARQMGRVDESLAESEAALGLLDPSGAARELGDALLCRAEVLIDQRSRRAELTSTLRDLDDVISRIGHGQFILHSDRAADILRFAVAKRIGGTYRDLLRRLEPDSEHPGESRSPFPLIEVRALGVFETKLDGREITPMEWESEKSRELFLLLITTGRPMTRGEIVAALWPDSERRKSTSAFHSTLHRARRALYPKVIVESGGWYSLQTEASFGLDVQRFLDLTRPAIDAEAGGQTAEADRLAQAVAMYTGPFAPNVYGEWAEDLRHSLEDRFVAAAVRLGQLLNAARSHQRAGEAFERALAIDKFSETAWYGLMLADAAIGGRERALRTYRRYENLLRTELDSVPEGRIAALSRQLRERRLTS